MISAVKYGTPTLIQNQNKLKMLDVAINKFDFKYYNIQVFLSFDFARFQNGYGIFFGFFPFFLRLMWGFGFHAIQDCNASIFNNYS